MLTKIDKIGKNSAVLIFSCPKYFFALSASYGLYPIFAGTDQGGLLPLMLLMPPRKTGKNLGRVWNGMDVARCD